MKIKNLFKTIKYLTILVFILAPNYNSYAWGMKEFINECSDNGAIPPMQISLATTLTYAQEYNCRMTLRDYLLAKNSEVSPRLNKIHLGNGVYDCSIASGQWKVRDNENSYITLYNPQDVYFIPIIDIKTLVEQLGNKLKCAISLYYSGTLSANVGFVSGNYYASKKWDKACFTESMCKERYIACNLLNHQIAPAQLGVALNCSIFLPKL